MRRLGEPTQHRNRLPIADSIRRLGRIAVPAVVFAWSVGAAAQDPAQVADDHALSPRNANYRIEVRLDPEAKMLHGRQTLTWRNIEAQPTDELWFHLYWNAWMNNRSTWMLELRLRSRWHRGPQRAVREEDWGFLEVESVRRAAGPGYPATDISGRARFASPDDGNPDDRTVLVVSLPTPVGPGETVQVEMTWRAKIPRTFARTGFRGDYYFFAHWFPKLGVFEEEGWNCHQYHAATEYYSDYGNYDVAITVPRSYVVGATGKLSDRMDNPDGTATHRYLQSDVHAFSWTASPDYIIEEARFSEPGLPSVDMRLLLQPEHLAQAERHFEATRSALRNYGKWFGPYPYDHVTIVDPAYGSGAGGMEYPTLFTAGTRLFNPFGGGSPESVTIHECGHQFWYGIVGNNEFEFAWIDEGFNSFADARTMAADYGDTFLVRRYLKLPGTWRRRGFLPVPFRDIKRDRMVAGNDLNDYRESATWDPPQTPTFSYYPDTSGGLSYNKTALWLSTLERHLGWETLQRIMSTFFERWQFKHPRPQDFFDIANEVSGQDLSWFFDQVHRSSVDFDYAVESVKSDPVGLDGYAEGAGGLAHVEVADEPSTYRTEVVVRRRGAGVFPVDVLMVFDDGSEVRDRWDGRYRWKLYVEERPARLDYAVVDPERILLLDLYPTNNSRRLEPGDRLPARKWASKWMIWLQDLMATFAFFV
jgi:hypothetical protein